MAEHDCSFILPGEKLPDGGAAEVGTKAWNLMLLARAGLPVPPGFVLPTSWCHGSRDPALLRQTLAAGIAKLEAATGLAFGSGRCPLLVSVRSGAAESMPGMLETVLDIGLNEHSIEGLIRLTGNPRLAWDCDRRFVQCYAEVVAGLPCEPFDSLLHDVIAEAGAAHERGPDHRALRRIALAMRESYAALTGAPVPADPMQQLANSAEAVFRSWDAPRAVTWRRLKKLDDNAGTAVTVQAMVFGNAGATSGSGVAFTRDPATGQRVLYCDFCPNGQGEDVVAGRRTISGGESLRATMPDTWESLQALGPRLEALFGDAQDFEFTVQTGVLYLLQTRSAQRTPLAALRMAVDMVAEGLITRAEALQRLRGIDLDALGRCRFATPLPPALARAVIASAGVACGPVALDEAALARLADAGETPILVRPETLTGDIAGLARAAGLLTAAGSRTAHAAVVARQLGKVCLVGCADLTIDLASRSCTIGDAVIAEGEPLGLDGNSGAVYRGELPVITEQPEAERAVVARWQAEAESTIASA